MEKGMEPDKKESKEEEVSVRMCTVRQKVRESL